MNEQLIATVRTRLPDDFSGFLLDGSLRVLADTDNRVRVHLFAAGIRELNSHILHTLAPNEAVLQCPWFAAQREARARACPNLTVAELNRPTRRQRVTYSLQGGITDEQITAYGSEPGDIHRELRDAIEELNRLTHVRPETIVDSVGEIDRVAEGILVALGDFYNALDHCRERISDAIFNVVHQATFDELTRETIAELDILSQHTHVDGLAIEEIKVASIDSQRVHYIVTGEVEVTLNYGSGTDSVSTGDSFPFELTMDAIVASPEEFENVACNVDTASFYD